MSEVDLNLYTACRLCPRSCGVDRTAGQLGYCGESADSRIASIGAHFGEEPSFSGTKGSGTVFFAGCSCHCTFCQNYQISNEHLGDVYDLESVLTEVKALAAKGVHNINFVTPDHFWPHIAAIADGLREEGIDIPLLFNSSGYENADMVDSYAEKIDIFMPDYKFTDPELANQCMKGPDYPEIALEAICKMVEHKGFLHPWDPTGEEPAREGVLVRHLVLPGHLDNSLKVLDTLHREFGPRIPISVMSQFRPTVNCGEQDSMSRMLYPLEYKRVCERIEKLGFEHVYLQDQPDTPAFSPDFTQDQPFEGNKTASDN